MKVLVLDDDKAVLNVVSTILEQAGHEVEPVEDPAVAVKMVAKEDYDIILFDYKMGVRDGIWFLKNVDIPKSTSAILMTGYGTRNLVNRVFSLGASGYLMKPFTADELLKHVEFHCARKLSSGILPPDGSEDDIPASVQDNRLE